MWEELVLCGPTDWRQHSSSDVPIEPSSTFAVPTSTFQTISTSTHNYSHYTNAGAARTPRRGTSRERRRRRRAQDCGEESGSSDGDQGNNDPQCNHHESTDNTASISQTESPAPSSPPAEPTGLSDNLPNTYVSMYAPGVSLDFAWSETFGFPPSSTNSKRNGSKGAQTICNNPESFRLASCHCVDASTQPLSSYYPNMATHTKRFIGSSEVQKLLPSVLRTNYCGGEALEGISSSAAANKEDHFFDPCTPNKFCSAQMVRLNSEHMARVLPCARSAEGKDKTPLSPTQEANRFDIPTEIFTFTPRLPWPTYDIQISWTVDRTQGLLEGWRGDLRVNNQDVGWVTCFAINRHFPKLIESSNPAVQSFVRQHMIYNSGWGSMPGLAFQARVPGRRRSLGFTDDDKLPEYSPSASARQNMWSSLDLGPIYLVTDMTVQPQYRGHGFGLFLLDGVCRRVANPLSSLVVISLREARDETLAKYVSFLGFRPLDDDPLPEFCARRNGRFGPCFEDICPSFTAPSKESPYSTAPRKNSSANP